MNKYHLFVWSIYSELGYGFEAYRGTFTDLNEAYAATEGVPNAELAVTQEDGSLAKVATLMLTQEDVPHRGRITIYFWQFTNETVEVDRKYHKWSALPRKRYDNPGFNHLATGRAEFGRWVESEPF